MGEEMKDVISKHIRTKHTYSFCLFEVILLTKFGTYNSTKTSIFKVFFYIITIMKNFESMLLNHELILEL